MNYTYLRFSLFENDESELIQKGNYIFMDNYLSLHEVSVIYYVLHYVTNYNLSDLELFLRLSGFCAFTSEEMEKPYSKVFDFSLIKNMNSAHRCTKEQAIKAIKLKFGSDSIENFKEFKRLQTERKLENLQTEINDLKEEKNKLDQTLKLIL